MQVGEEAGILPDQEMGCFKNRESLIVGPYQDREQTEGVTSEGARSSPVRAAERHATHSVTREESECNLFWSLAAQARSGAWSWRGCGRPAARYGCSAGAAASPAKVSRSWRVTWPRARGSKPRCRRPRSSY